VEEGLAVTLRIFLMLATLAVLWSCQPESVQSNSKSHQELASEVQEIALRIKTQGPLELRSMDINRIEDAVSGFVYGRESGILSPAHLARLGGVEGAATNALMAQYKASR